ncbi:hypothetical protein [Limnohabitans sp. Jir72]|uniref:hypothetical protein n=1 Tax=Limnohabitans sp. Jir72 TaxID=1977909 RepID=UPI001E5E12C8|nr:hypothetical protein [Limnohabitans sp. Jir72]
MSKHQKENQTGYRSPRLINGLAMATVNAIPSQEISARPKPMIVILSTLAST